MNCPYCGRSLNMLEEVLAATETGTQCRNCWKMLRRLRPERRRARVTPFKPARQGRPQRSQRRAA